jgi:RecB family exonuclease
MRLFTSLTAENRLKAASEFLESHSGEESVVIAPTRNAADELLRGICSRRGSVLGVRRFTVPQLAIETASSLLAESGKTILAGVAIDALAARSVSRCAKQQELSWFGPVAHTPGFFRALASTLTELRMNRVDPERLRASGPAGQDLANLLKRYGADLDEAGSSDLAAVFETATVAAQRREWAFAGLPILFLDITPVTLLEEEFLKACTGLSSDVLATVHSRDEQSIEILRRVLNGAPVVVSPTEDHTALGRLRSCVFRTETPLAGDFDDSVCFTSATDESRECVEIARAILTASGSGAAFDCMAVLLRNPDLYQPLLEDSLRRAGIPAFYSRGTKRPNPAGRALLSLLACVVERLSATRFSEYLSLGQVPEIRDTPDVSRPPKWVPPQGELFPELAPEETERHEETTPDLDSPVAAGTLRTPRHWERLLVDAAVIGGHDRWVRRLAGLRNELRKRLQELGAEDEAARLRLERELRQLDNLQRFALPIIAFLDSWPEAATWGEWLSRLEQLAMAALRQPEGVLSVLAELRPMSGIGPVGLDEVREALAERLTFLREEPAERRYGKVFVASISEISGMSFEFVFLPGLGEDIFPKKSFEDPLLLDAARSEVSSHLATQEQRFARERMLLHIAASAARSKLWISYSRMDLRQGRARGPSFYAMDVLRAITGRIPGLGELQKKAAEASQSQIGWPAPRDPAVAIDTSEFDLAVIRQGLRNPQSAHGYGRYLLETSDCLGRSLRARWGRWERRWSPADGLLANVNDLSMTALRAHRLSARPYSPTALQHFAVCPYRFLLNSIYRLQPREEKVALERMDPLTRGSLFHSLQFHLFTRLQTLNLLPITENNLASVFTVADEVLAEVTEAYREETAPAIPRIWDAEIEELRWDARGWIRQSALAPGASLWKQSWFELAFGLRSDRQYDPRSSTDPVLFAGGRRLRGSIDLIEENNGRLRVTDHKTGRAPTKRIEYLGEGEVLQPLLYALAAEAMLGMPVDSTRLSYCTERGHYKIVEITVDEASREALAKALDAIDLSIASGFLPAAPRKGGCDYCDYRIVCGPYEEFRFRRKPDHQLSLLTELRDIP